MSTAIRKAEERVFTSAPLRLKIFVRGAVQGVGFRPFVYRTAKALHLNGWVRNSPQGVSIELEGEKEQLDIFLLRLRKDLPQIAFIQSVDSRFLDPAGYQTFEIRPSDDEGARSAVVLPDIAICFECAREVLDPSNRRYQYPFTNCTNCGPRYSIIESLPYDRPNTSMKTFKMCADCRAEYEDPQNRRFHAQPNACQECGPKLELWDRNGAVLWEMNSALVAAADALARGKIVAVKGLGGFHLMADARRDRTISELRARKHREEKPLALMVPSIEAAGSLCTISAVEESRLRSPEAPIVLLKRSKPKAAAWHTVSKLAAPGNPYLGLMLPYTPIHLLLMNECRIPLVATSGNLSDEPICIDEREALERLGGIADIFLVHNRPIVRHVDDSIVRVMLGREIVLRRARGYAPLPVMLGNSPTPVVAYGAHLKSSIAAAAPGAGAVISQHIGDLDTESARAAFRRTVLSVTSLFEIAPEITVCDAHPDYFSTGFAIASGLPVIAVQHHYAHILSCMAENEIEAPVLGAAWDGTGYGTDGTIWGGEFLLIGDVGFDRAGHFRRFLLPGGEKAVREPRRSALGLLYELYGEKAFDLPDCATLEAFSPRQLSVTRSMLAGGLNSPVTSSAGRLFDAVASILGVRQLIRFEGQAAMELEFLADGIETGESYDFKFWNEPDTPITVDWGPMIDGIFADKRLGIPVEVISARFHNTLAEWLTAFAELAGQERVVMSGGCFQNRYLAERCVKRLREEGFQPYWHQRVPPNDGGIALGQLSGAARVMNNKNDAISK